MRKIVIGVIVLLLAVITVKVVPQYSGSSSAKLTQLTNARKNLVGLIEAEDGYFQRNGMYVALAEAGNNDVRENLGWCETGCGECRYSVSVQGRRFTAEANCQTSDGKQQYLGYVRTAPGELIGIEPTSGKCGGARIYAGSRYLVNNLGPCHERSWYGMAVASGSKRHLVLETFPPGAAVFINGAEFGDSEVNHTSLSSKYGTLYISDLPENPVKVKVSKEGYRSVEFEMSWGSYTHRAAVVLSGSTPPEA